MFVSEEVFLIVRGLSTDRSFTWRQWLRAWQTLRPPNPWGGTTMAVSAALKQQCLNGTVKRISRGLYFFVEDVPRAPFSLKKIRRPPHR